MSTSERIAALEAALEDTRESRSRAHDRADEAIRKVLQLQAELGQAESRIAALQKALGETLARCLVLEALR